MERIKDMDVEKLPNPDYRWNQADRIISEHAAGQRGSPGTLRDVGSDVGAAVEGSLELGIPIPEIHKNLMEVYDRMKQLDLGGKPLSWHRELVMGWSIIEKHKAILEGKPRPQWNISEMARESYKKTRERHKPQRETGARLQTPQAVVG